MNNPVPTIGARRGTSCRPSMLACSAALLLLALAVPADAAVYKWLDTQGRIHYSDRPPPPDGKLISVDPNANLHGERSQDMPRTTLATPATPPLAASAAAAAAPTNGPAATPEANARIKQEVDTEVATVRADQCKQAQDKYQKEVRSRRLYKEGPNKERIYLTDDELEAERLQARRDVDEFCPPSR